MTTTFTNEYRPIPLPDYVELPVEEMRRRAKVFYDVIRKRHTVRDFSSRAVPRDIIEQCLLAAGTAPSGANHQPWHFCVIGDPKMKKLIRDAAEKEEQAFYSGRAVRSGWMLSSLLGLTLTKHFLKQRHGSFVFLDHGRAAAPMVLCGKIIMSLSLFLWRPDF